MSHCRFPPDVLTELFLLCILRHHSGTGCYATIGLPRIVYGLGEKVNGSWLVVKTTFPQKTWRGEAVHFHSKHLGQRKTTPHNVMSRGHESQLYCHQHKGDYWRGALPPQTPPRPSGASRTRSRPPCWRQRRPHAEDPRSPLSHSQRRGSPTCPGRCRLSCATWQRGITPPPPQRLEKTETICTDKGILPYEETGNLTLKPKHNLINTNHNRILPLFKNTRKKL